MSEDNSHDSPQEQAKAAWSEAEVDRAKAEAERARAEAKKAEAAASKIRAEIRAVKLNTAARKTDAEVENIKAKAKAEAKAEVKAETKAEAKAEAKAEVKAEAEAKRLNAESEKVQAETQKLNAEIKRASQSQNLFETASEQMTKGQAGTGIREFVRESLLDIMGAVDDAAAVGKTREFNEGLVGYLPSVTAIGDASVDNHSSAQVEFDLAVTVIESDSASGDKGAALKIGVPAIFGVSIAASGYLQSSTGHASEREQTNRIRFSVPIKYAREHAPIEDE